MVDENSNLKIFPGSGGTSPSRTMPNNLQAEQNLLGAILLDNSVLERIDDRLLADHFYDPFHGSIFSTMQRLAERGQLANPVTLKSFSPIATIFKAMAPNLIYQNLPMALSASRKHPITPKSFMRRISAASLF